MRKPLMSIFSDSEKTAKNFKWLSIAGWNDALELTSDLSKPTLIKPTDPNLHILRSLKIKKNLQGWNIDTSGFSKY